MRESLDNSCETITSKKYSHIRCKIWILRSARFKNYTCARGGTV